MALRTVGVRLVAEIAGYQQKLRAAGQYTRDFAGELDKASKQGKLDKVGDQAALLGVGLAGVAAGAIKLRADFDKAMSGVAAATHANAAEMKQLQAAALEAGKNSQYSATEAADAITELSKAGVSTADVLGGGLKGSLDLAAAGQLSVSEAAETAASALTQFQLKGNQVPHVADLLAAAAGKAQGSVHDMGYALNQSGLVAAQFGLSIEDTTGVLGEFANAGLTGSDAGTSFKTMLLAMANPADQTKNLMDELGISFYDAQGQFIGLTGVAQVLQRQLKGLTQEQRNAALGQIFGNDAIRAASILYTDGADGVKEWKNAVNDSGYASETAAKLTDNLAGDLERLRGALETVAIESGGGASEGLRKLTQGAESAVEAFGSLPGWVQQTVTVMSGIGGVSLLAAAGFIKARSTAKTFLAELTEMGPAGARTAGGLSKISGIAGKLGIAGAAAVGLYEGFKLFGDWIDHFSAPVTRDVDKMGQALLDFADNGKAAGELARTFGTDLRGLQKDIETLATSQQKLAKISSFPQSVYAGRGGGAAPNAADKAKLEQEIAQAKVNIAALDQALANLVNSGNATAAKVAFDDFAAATGLSLKDLSLYPEAAKGAAQANTGLAKGFGSAASNAKTMTYSLESATEAGQKLTDVWLQLNGAVLASDQANLAAKQAIDDVKDSFKENKRAVDGNSEAALKNRIAVGEAAKKAAEAAQAKYEETGSVTAANKVYDDYLAQLRKTLTQAGLNKKQVDQLLGSYAKMPPTIATNVKQPGMDPALTKTEQLWKKLKGVDGNWVARVSMPGYADVKDKLLGLMSAQQALKDNTSPAEARRELARFFAGGGPVYGPGTGTSDSIAARLSHGEHVWTAAEVAAIGGQQAMIALRRAVRAGKRVEFGDETPGFAAGGPVTVMPFRENLTKTHIPKDVWSIPGGSGGPGYRWMEAVVRAAFPGLRVISDFRPGAMTLTGNRSYHGFGRAVDYPPSRPLAEWINFKYKARTKELITPWNDLNIHNGARHTYTGAVWNQHNFAGGNAHDHWAMKHGGTITEPIFGVGASGRTYSFGENYQPERVTPNWQGGGAGGVTNIHVGGITITAPVGSSPREIGSQVADVLDSYCRGGGRVQLRGTVTA